VQKLKSYTDIAFLLNSLTTKSNFIYNGINYGAMVANDKQVIVRNFKTGVSVGKQQFLQSLDNDDTSTVVTTPKEEPHKNIPISNDDYNQCFITPTILSSEFISYMQIKDFIKEYEVHPNIGLMDFGALKQIHPHLKLSSKRNVLYSKTSEAFNISVKWSIDKGWYSVAGTKAGIGAFLKSDSKATILILVEGLKDGINASIAFPMADILVANGKSNKYNFKVHGIDLAKYKNILYANDKDNEEQLISMFGVEHKTHYKKTKYLDWSKISQGKDLTDIIEHIILPKHPTKRDRKRGALATLKKLLHKSNFESEYKKLRDKEASKTLDLAMEKDDKQMAMRAIKTLNLFNGNLLNGAKYYLDKQRETKTNSNLNIDLGHDSRLSNHTDKIIGVLNKSSKVFLNAPTGTGKSYTSLQELPKHFKNIIIISPLRMVTDEHGADETPYTNIEFNDKFEAVEADLNSPYIAITTDVFIKLKARYGEAFTNRLNDAELIIFDEQHLYYDSLGFRDATVVACYDYLLYKYNGKILFMSGTPILPNDIEVSLITAKVLETAKKHINFYNNPFDNVGEIVESIKEELEKGSVLLYSESVNKAKEAENLLIENGIKTILITSYEHRLNGENVDKNVLNDDLGKIVYISTTKATTGVNFDGLKTIYQYGTPYTPNTFIQLVARLRGNGKFFLIEPKYTQKLEQDNTHRAIGLSKSFQKNKIKKISDSFYSEEFQQWLKHFVLLPHSNKNLKGFLRTYQKAFQLIEAKGLGKFNKTNDDFEFIGHQRKEISKLFAGDSKNEFRKYIEQILIDWIVRNDIEMLNSHYNLSYVIHNATIKVSKERHQLITNTDKEAKKESREEKKDELKELYSNVDKKFEELEITAKLFKKHKFSDTEMSKLLDIKIHIEKLKDIKSYEDKLTALKFHLIPKQAIFKIANVLIVEDGYLTVKELDSKLQEIYITNARKKNPYEKLLIEAFSNDFFNNSYLQFNKRKMIDKKQYYNTLTISKEHKKYFEDLKSKKAKEDYLENEFKKAIGIEKFIEENSSKFEIVLEDAEPKQEVKKVKSIEELIQEQERKLEDESISSEIRMKTMHELAILKGEVRRE
jgi:hypothetical protein